MEVFFVFEARVWMQNIFDFIVVLLLVRRIFPKSKLTLVWRLRWRVTEIGIQEATVPAY